MLTPYYERDGVTLYHGDCLEILPQLEGVDHVITDPPYAEETHEGARTDGPKGEGTAILIDFAPFTEADVRHAFTLVRVNRWAVSFMDWRHVAALERCPPHGLRFVRFGVWYKPNGTPQFTGDRPSTGWEALAIMHAADKPLSWNGGGRHGVFIEPKVNTEHPTGKPITLVKQLVELFTDPGDLILDPFSGSGTTAVAAYQLGRRCIAIEKEEKWCEVAAKRLEGCTPPLPIFREQAEQPVLLEASS